VTLLAGAIAGSLASAIGAVLVWGWVHDALRTSEQEMYDWKFEAIVRHETGGRRRREARDLSH
jgi:hypothetical protein